MSNRRFCVASNIAVHGLAYAVEHERQLFIARGCSAGRALDLALVVCTGRVVR